MEYLSTLNKKNRYVHDELEKAKLEGTKVPALNMLAEQLKLLTMKVRHKERHCGVIRLDSFRVRPFS